MAALFNYEADSHETKQKISAVWHFRTDPSAASRCRAEDEEEQGTI